MYLHSSIHFAHVDGMTLCMSILLSIKKPSLKVVANKDLGHQQQWILTHQHCTTCLRYLMLNPDFQPCPPFQSAVTEELIKWVWLGLKTVIRVKIMVKIQKGR